MLLGFGPRLVVVKAIIEHFMAEQAIRLEIRVDVFFVVFILVLQQGTAFRVDWRKGAFVARPDGKVLGEVYCNGQIVQSNVSQIMLNVW